MRRDSQSRTKQAGPKPRLLTALWRSVSRRTEWGETCRRTPRLTVRPTTRSCKSRGRRPPPGRFDPFLARWRPALLVASPRERERRASSSQTPAAGRTCAPRCAGFVQPKVGGDGQPCLAPTPHEPCSCLWKTLLPGGPHRSRPLVASILAATSSIQLGQLPWATSCPSNSASVLLSGRAAIARNGHPGSVRGALYRTKKPPQRRLFSRGAEIRTRDLQSPRLAR